MKQRLISHWKESYEASIPSWKESYEASIPGWKERI
jgi:hypothetical protein